MDVFPTLQYFFIGSLLGLTAGISPGPLLTLVIAQTLKHNKQEGIKIAVSPLITDLPIILLTAFLFIKVAQFDGILAIISFAGSVFLAYLGYGSIKTKGLEYKTSVANPGSLKKGIVVNLLSPHPYLFWAIIGTPYVFRAYEQSMVGAVLFLASFYLFLVGSKVMVAILTSRSKVFLGQKSYLIIMKLLGVALLVFSIILVIEGLEYLGVI
jgi:threonine/homoserine/homoserine lactone efflux protein